jgi:PPP family 3-phenylpropionic acid transporter
LIKSIPYWRLSSFYWFYFATLGAFIPYWSLYLSHSGFSADEIGELIAVVMGTKIVAPYIWGWIADHHNNRVSIIRFGAVAGFLAFSGVFISSDYWWLLLVLMVFSFFWNAILPQFEALTFNHLARNEHQYSWIRVWGSLGFIVTVTLLGLLLMVLAIDYLPWFILLLLFGIALSTFINNEIKQPQIEQPHFSILKILNNPKVIGLLLACLLVQASHGPYYTFYSIYAEAHGYEKSWIGVLWAIGVSSEVIAFAMMPWLVGKFGFRNLLLFSLFSGSLRWLLIAFYIDSAFMTTFAQIFHASTFGIYHAVAIAYIHRYFKGKNQGKGQALYSSVSFGIGGALGSLLGGYLWDTAGAAFTFTMAALVSFLAFLISWRLTEA